MIDPLNKSPEIDNRDLLFILGILPDELSYPVIRYSKNVIQFAADAYQRALIEGVGVSRVSKTKILNLPFVGSYPYAFKRIFFPPINFRISKNEITGVGFLNIVGLQLPSRCLSSFISLVKILDSKPAAIVVYSAHLPFLMSAIMKKFLHSNQLVVVILPDLPEFMSTGSIFHSFAKQVERLIFGFALNYVDGLILFSRHMADALQLKKETPHIVVEGIYSNRDLEPSPTTNVESNYLLYSGTLDRRYGISDLLQAFESLQDSDLELWICGEGNGREDVKNAALANMKIKYLGQLPRDEVLNIQKSAFALVNPRRPDEDFTHFSFPSKTIEYMASGRPTIIHRLGGIPSEYFAHAVVPKTGDMLGLAEAIKDVCEMSTQERSKIGGCARHFVLTNKSAEHQANRIIEFIGAL